MLAGFELRTSAKKVSVHRQEIREQLLQGAREKAAWPLQDEVARAEAADETFHEPAPLKAGKTHLTTMREVNVDKYRITFEAHQACDRMVQPLG